MRKILLLIVYCLFMIGIDTVNFILATVKLTPIQKLDCGFWQWFIVGFFFFSLQALTYNCKMGTRLERVMIAAASSAVYYTIFIICLTKKLLCNDPYTQIISYNTVAFILLTVITIAGILGGTFKIGLKLSHLKRQKTQW